MIAYKLKVAGVMLVVAFILGACYVTFTTCSSVSGCM